MPGRPTHDHRRRLTRAGGAVALAASVTGCGLSSPQTTLVPRSDFAGQSHSIFLQILWWDVAIFVVVATVLCLAILRFRERDPDALPRQVRGNARLELGWTLAPAIVLTFIAFPTVGAIFRTQALPPPGALKVRVTGHQWWWEFHYPELGITTASELYLPAGQRVSLDLGSVDVIHSFWVPGLGGKRDTIPGQVNRILLTPGTPGDYPGQCAEFCGASHANMRHLAVVVPAQEFQAWVTRQKAAPAEPAEGSPAAQGRQLFTAQPCVGCHAIQGVSAGQIGPDLSHFGSRQTIAGGMLRNTTENLARWLKNPPAVKPGSLMPDLRLTDGQVTALVAYLVSLK
ncbi:MAG: cytochrome c oxidase subunit II [Candidatus Rokubacteria bacterium]|nr:cytochrome c oxidase subunit II [Candidatus Rokubacteria bacterium]